MINIRKLEAELWESADLLRASSKLTSVEYCMPVLGLIFLRYAYSRFKMVEADILKDRPVRNGRVLPVEPKDFSTKNALFLPEKAQYSYLLNLPDSEDIGKAVNAAMELLEAQSPQLKGILPNTYTSFQNDLLRELLRIFQNETLDKVGGDVIGRIYEYFLSKFAPNVASDDGVFFTPKSLVQMIVNILEPKRGIVLDPACGSGGMFVQTGDFVSASGTSANTAMTFYGQEKVEYNAKLCLMNMAVHGLNGNVKSGDEANSFYNDAHSLVGLCDYVMANPPFNVDKVKSESAQNAGRLPFGLPTVNKDKEISNANYLWISYFYAYLNEKGRAGFVMASSATDSKDKGIREQLVRTGHVDVMLSVSNNFFYTKSLPCALWFFDKAKAEQNKDRVLFIDSRNYYTVVDRTLNEWSEWQLKNINAIVWLYRGEKEKYENLLMEYRAAIVEDTYELKLEETEGKLGDFAKPMFALRQEIQEKISAVDSIFDLLPLNEMLKQYAKALAEQVKAFSEIVDDDITATADRRNKKVVANAVEALTAEIRKVRTIIKEAKWLTEKFGDGEYADIAGLCKCASIAEIEGKGWSLTPGAYVGVTAQEEDDEDFAERMTTIHNELRSLHTQANELMETIITNFEGLDI